MTRIQRIIVCVLALGVATVGSICLCVEYGPQGTRTAVARVSPTTSPPSTPPAGGDGGACALIRAALDAPRPLPDPVAVVAAARAAETAPDRRISTLGGPLGIRAEMALGAEGAPDGPTRLGEMTAGAIQLRAACVQALYS